MGSEIKNTAVEEMNAAGGPRFYVPKTELTERNQFELCRNPLELPPVIRCVLKYLDTQDVINLRLVSKEWSSVGLSALTTRSVEFFLPGKLSKFYQVFSQSYFKSVNFKNITFSGMENQTPWLVDELNEFFEKEGKQITKLKLEDIQLVDKGSKNISTFRLTPWLSNCAMTKGKTEDNTKLSVRCFSFSVIFSIDVSVLSCIKRLTLTNVRVNVQEGIQISPIKLKLVNASFFKDGKKLSHLHLNDIFDFSKTTCIKVLNQKNTKHSLELNGSGKLEHLQLFGATLSNFKTCRWEVKKLSIFNAALTETTQMQIKELVVEYCQSLDIAYIPLSVEKIRFSRITEGTLLFSQRVVLPNIKFLYVNFQFNVFSLFTENLAFPNLTHIRLENNSDRDLDMELNLAWIPNTVRIMSLTKIKISKSGRNALNLERLILTPSQPFKIEEFCECPIRTKELVLHFRLRNTKLQNNVQQILDTLEHQKSCTECFQRFYVSNLFWGESKFDASSPLYCYVDQEANFYMFDNQKGKAITFKEFDLLIDLSKIYDEIKLKK